jgi:hypothetical protein
MVELGILEAPGVVGGGEGEERGLATGELEQRGAHLTRISEPGPGLNPSVMAATRRLDDACG